MPYPIYSATGHGFGKPRRQAADPAGTDYSGNQAFQPLPAPVGAYPFHLDLRWFWAPLRLRRSRPLAAFRST